MNHKTTQLINEKQLVKSCLRGDLLAQKNFYHRFAEKMMGVCLRYAKSWEDAEDLLQMGFMQVFSDLRHFRGNGSLEGWIRKVMVNKALQQIRKRKNSIFINVEVDDLPEPSEGGEMVYHQLVVEDLLKMLRKLPDGCQVVFNLYVMEGYNHQEIAEQLGISLGTSKSQLSRARSLLKGMMKNLQVLV